MRDLLEIFLAIAVVLLEGFGILSVLKDLDRVMESEDEDA